MASVQGTRPSVVTLMSLPVAITAHVGPRLGAAWDEKYAIGLHALGLQVQGAGRKIKDGAELTATSQDAPGPALEGAGFAIVAAPTAEFRNILRRLSVAYDLPRNERDGTPSKDLALARQSYWFLSFGEADTDKVLDLCRQSGIRQVMLLSGAWCRSPGHYAIQPGYPDGVESLRRMVDRLHGAGIMVGMHCYASKVGKIDGYVSPKPDRRFWVDRMAALTDPIGTNETAVLTNSDLREWPGSPVAHQKVWEGGVAKHQDVVIDDEIIRYKSIGPEGKWNTFLGCERGAYATTRSPHPITSSLRHYAVDGGINGYIIDQETTLLDEVTMRLADIFDMCGFDMIYFDGGEDVDTRRFIYYVSKFQAVAMSKFRKRPIIHMGTIMTHNLWHSFTRSGTVDTYMNTLRGQILAGAPPAKWPTVREHIDRSVAYMLSVREDMMPGELGWFGIWPKGKDTDGLQLDEVEYLMAKSLGHDAPISLETSFREMASHPLTPGILEIVRAYETLRSNAPPPAEIASLLRTPGKDFILVQEDNAAEFVEARVLPTVAGSHDVRGLVAEYKTGAIATLWHYMGTPGTLVISSDPEKVRAMDVFGKPIEVTVSGNKISIPFGARRTILFVDNVSKGILTQTLDRATLAQP